MEVEVVHLIFQERIVKLEYLDLEKTCVDEIFHQAIHAQMPSLKIEIIFKHAI